MKIIGLTGGIGSGKSTVAKMFETLGVPVYYSDVAAKKIMHTSKIVQSKLIDIFGEHTFLEGVLNREYLAQIVFNDKEKLAILNSIVHPEVKKHFKGWVSKQYSQYVIQENAIIFENGSQKDFDKIITVTAPEDIRISRVMSRDKATKQMVIARMQNQMKDFFKVENSDFVIYNEGLEKTHRDVCEIHKQLVLICS